MTIESTDRPSQIGRLSFGCARILGGAEALATQRLIETALACGIRHFDTAPSYGAGHSERLLGDVIAGMTDVMVTTKVGIARPPLDQKPSSARALYRRFLRPALAMTPALKRALLGAAARPPSGAPAAPRVRLSVATVQASLDESERFLRRRVDTYLLHEPDRLVLDDGVADHFSQWRAEGRIGAFGWGTGSVPSAPLEFGTVRQQLYDPACPLLAEADRRVIFHGILRSAQLAGASASERLASALVAHPNASFIFSASAPTQIRQLVDQLR